MANPLPLPAGKVARLLCAAALTLALGATVATSAGEPARSADDPRPTLGLVNEDLPARFNGDEYTFGTSFVDRISRDSEYNWIVLSRAVAEKAYTDGSVDAVLYIPQSFTQDLLSLQELSPTKATIEYKLGGRAEESAERLLESRIVSVVHGFNEGIVRMYYASVADNLAEAEGQMRSTLSNQEALLAALGSDVDEPFSEAIPGIQNLVSSATSLNDVNAATLEAQNAFTESVTNSLAASGEAISGQLPAIDDFMQTQREIARINASNSNNGIDRQATSDREFYGAQFEGLRTTTLCRLSGVDATVRPAPCTLPDGTIPPHVQSRILDLRQITAQYATSHSQAISGLVADLDARIQNLRAVHTLLATPISRAAQIPDSEPSTPLEPDEPPSAIPVDPVDPEILADLDTEIRSLETTRDSLDTTLPGPELDTELSLLDDSLADAITAVTNLSLTPNTVTTLDVSDWSSYHPDASGLYVDSGSELHASMTDLIAQTTQSGRQVAGSAATLPDDSDRFDALVRDASSSLSSAQTVSNGLAGLLATGGIGLEETQSYYANFSTVLANTRAQGVDTAAIYDFFAAPIDARNITPDGPATASTTGASGWWNWLVVFAGGMLAGILSTALGNARRKRKRA